MGVVQKELTRFCGVAKTHMVQYDIPGIVRSGSRWAITIQMKSRNGNWPYGAFTQLIIFPTSKQDGKNRGWLENGFYVSWFGADGKPSCDGYEALVEEDGERSNFKIGRKIVRDVRSSDAGAILSVTYSFTLSEFGSGYSFAVFGGQYSGSYDELKVTVVGTTVD